jgi:hypothetical protein
MSIRSLLLHCASFPLLVSCAGLLAQEKPANVAAVREFPVTMRQNIVAGKTPVGTKVEAKLTVATLVDGTVIPRNAIFSGEVVESAGKSGTDPSRLAIRMDSVQWKKGTAPIKLFLTSWYYPVKITPGQDLMFGPPEGPISKTWNGAGTYPVDGSPASQPFPGRESQKTPEVTPVCTSSCVSDHRAVMPDIESTTTSAGEMAITSSRTNIKLDKVTTYVLATGDLKPSK